MTWGSHGDFVIDTPNHKRWWLPDRVHQYNSFMYGNTVKDTIINGFTGETVLSLPAFSLDDPHWQDHAELAQELARKRFPARKEREVSAYMKSYRR